MSARKWRGTPDQEYERAIRKTLRIRKEHIEAANRNLKEDLAFLAEIDARLFWFGIYPEFEHAMQDGNPECIGIRIEDDR